MTPNEKLCDGLRMNAGEPTDPILFPLILMTMCGKLTRERRGALRPSFNHSNAR